MANFGVDSNLGFLIKRLIDIQSSLQSSLIQVKDPDTGETLQANFDENDPWIQEVNGIIDELSTTWELMQAAANQYNPQLTSGPCLSGLVQLNGIQRKLGSPSTVVLNFTGSLGLRIPAGSLFTDSNALIFWKTTADLRLSTVDGTGSATCVSTVNGAFIVDIATVNIISSSITGLNTVNNAAASVPGVADETDASLRARRRNSTSAPAQSINEALYSAVMNVSGVTLCRLFINDTLTVDDNGLPTKTVASVIVGGADTDIAQAIFTRIGGAEKTYGNTTVNITDTMQQVNAISFVRPTPIAINVIVNISVIDVNTYPLDGDTQIKDNIVLFAQSGAAGIGIEETDKFDQSGFLPGDTVSVSRLYTPILAVPGLKINSVLIAVNPATPTAATDIEIDWDEIASFIIGNISVVRS